jgi:ABC-type cobalamin/Fe3+-siderophores transport system ATPase subunit
MMDIAHCTLMTGGKATIDDVNMSLTDGEIVGVIGRSGAGKTSLLKVIAGLIPETRGSIRINNLALSARQRRKSLEIAYYDGAAPRNPDERLFDFLLLSRTPHKKFMSPFSERDRQIAGEYADLMGLDEYRNEPVGNLPGGIMKRAMLAHSFIRQSCLLLLDNPTDGLDILSLRLLKRALSHHVMNGDRIALACSNDLNFIFRTADRIMVMEGGRIALTGGTDIMTAEMIGKYFGVEAVISRNIYSGKPEAHFFPDA